MEPEGLTRLSGDSYVLQTEQARSEKLGDMKWARVAGKSLGGDQLSQWLVNCETASECHYGFGHADVVIFVVSGAGTIRIADREFAFTAHSGIYVAPGETFSVSTLRSETAQLLIGVCPETMTQPECSGERVTFDDKISNRVIPLENQRRHATGDRFYQLLVNEQLGNCRVTQFIGAIPRSRAPEHFHEYEEIIMVLDGSGMCWTGSKTAPVRSGSIIYLPRRQSHCVECTDENGMLLVGMFYPAGSPAVRY